MESVTFTPHYTLRATSTGIDSTLNIRYHARITNNSGEDWNDVSLAISTAQASETTVIPRLMRWTVDFRAPVQKYNDMNKARKQMLMNNAIPAVQQQYYMQQQAQMAAYPSASASRGAFGGAVGGVSLDTVDADFETAAAEVSEGITSTFHIPGKQTLKDGEKNHTVVIRDLVLEGKFASISVPKVKDVAYLQVQFLLIELMIGSC
jgi:uncharacterized protein (TIGR02231 family)